VNSKQRATLVKIFRTPTAGDIRWADIESFMTAAGADIIQGAGSRVSFRLAGLRATFHAPHGNHPTHQATVEDLRDFLKRAGITP
jgi:hypothetical protein